MAGEISKLFVSINANIKPLMAGLRNSQAAMGKWAGSLGQGVQRASGVFDSFAGNLSAMMVSSAARAGGAFASTLISGVSKASDLNETVSKTRVLLGDAADEALNFAKIQESKGVASQQAVLDSVTSTYLMLKNQGMATKDALAYATKLEGRMGDIASMRNFDPAELRERIQSGLSGELQTLRGGGLNISLTADQMRTKYGAESALGAGDGKATGAAVIDAILQQTVEDAGDLERTQYSMANMARANAVKWEAGLTGIGQFFQEAGQAFEFLKSTVLDAFVGSLGDGQLQEAANNVYLGIMDLASVFMDFGPQMATSAGEMLTWVTDVFRGITQAIKMAFVDPLNLVKAGIAGFGIALIDGYKYLSKFLGAASGLPLDEWKKSLEDMQVDATSGMVDNIIAQGNTNFAEKMREKFQAGGTGTPSVETDTSAAQMQKDVKSSRSSLTTLLGDVIGSQDEKLININEAQLTALQAIAGAVLGRGADQVTGKGSLNTISNGIAAGAAGIAGGVL